MEIRLAPRDRCAVSLAAVTDADAVASFANIAIAAAAAATAAADRWQFSSGRDPRLRTRHGC